MRVEGLGLGVGGVGGALTGFQMEPRRVRPMKKERRDVASGQMALNPCRK